MYNLGADFRWILWDFNALKRIPSPEKDINISNGFAVPYEFHWTTLFAKISPVIWALLKDSQMVQAATVTVKNAIDLHHI